ncbi:dihydrodipicolinate synthase family protein [Phytoactinopolyspora halotolerans]|uniref:Dihydrodipicolinate synthase family protein n=1 Tax=Phytoactinopolyspora halotolerans TaxID=1981512 RepID=A0A6L9S613_9ACTN|nr:dihydrodipicolinate synthase family protein [Phytoactinopolyspora halotolerans]NEE00084.1 dihydrodipicolinate synthase family protein [Phytoactinopolyspora halotolerans]
MATTGKELLRGVTVPLVTPMDAPGEPRTAVGSGAELLTAMRDAGVDALMLLGSNGEGPLLPTDAIGAFTVETATLWRESHDTTHERPRTATHDSSHTATHDSSHTATHDQDGPSVAGPVLVNITAAGTAEVMDRAEAVLPASPDALVLSPPIYFHHRDDEIVAHYAACAELGIPVVAYNAPKYSNPITPQVFHALLEMEHVVGIKDSSGDLDMLRHMVKTAHARRPDFGVGQGAEGALADGLRGGADGIVPGIANIAPDVAVALHRAWCAESSPETGSPSRSDVHSAHHAQATGAPCADGDAAEDAAEDNGDVSADAWQTVVDQLCGIHRIRPGVPTIKAILDERGLCPPHVAPPLLPCTPDERTALAEYLRPHESNLIRRR